MSNIMQRVTRVTTGALLLSSAMLVQADQVILDDLIVDGSICVGMDCVNGESFGFDTIRLKENNLRIRFVDTSSTASFPSRDWQITVNDSANGGLNKFSIDDIDGGRTPFTIEAGAPTHSLYVDDSGRLGLGTSTPVVDLHIKTGNTPTLRLEQDGSSGFTPQTWDVAGNEANFFIRDATNGSTLPFKIIPSAPSNSLYIASDGDIGLGTTSPGSRLHLYSGATGDSFMTFGASASGPGFNMGYSGHSHGQSSAFLNVRPDASAVAPNPSLRFMTVDTLRLIIDNEGYLGIGTNNPSHPIEAGIANGAHLTVGGAWTNASSREYKDNIEKLSFQEASEALKQLEPVKYVYKNSREEQYVGFIAEDVPDLMAINSRKGLSSMDFVAMLTKVVQKQQSDIEKLTQKIAALELEKESEK